MSNDPYARTAAGMFATLSRRITAVERRLPPTPTFPPIPPFEPAGVVKMTAAAAAPTGYLLCDGASVSRTTYADLFAAIGTAYGSVDGASFNLPNLKGRVPVGRDAAQTEFDTLGETGGAKTHTLTVGEMPNHDHQQYYTLNGAAGSNMGAMASAGSSTYTAAEQYTEAVGGGGAHNNLQPYITLNYIIKT